MKAKVTIEGTSALLMNRYPDTPIQGLDKKPKEEQAEIAAYRIPGSRELYIPGINIQRALVGAAAFSKGKGRASLQKTVAACVMIEPEYVGLGTEKYNVDSRPVVIPATRGRVMRHRPRIDSWKVTFGIEWDETMMNIEQVKQVVEDMGKKVGLMDFRPANKGFYGRSKMLSFEKID